MSNTIKRFSYDVLKMGKEGRLPVGPFLYITLDNWTTDGKSRVPRISPQLTISEIDGYIQLLKEDLDDLAKRAKRDMKAADEETHRIMAERIAARNDNSN